MSYRRLRRWNIPLPKPMNVDFLIDLEEYQGSHESESLRNSRKKRMLINVNEEPEVKIEGQNRMLTQFIDQQ